MLPSDGQEPNPNAPNGTGDQRRRRQIHLVLALGLFLVTFGSILFTVSAPGLAWDEVFYLGGAESYSRWFERIGKDALQKDVLEEHWRVNSEHPPLAKLVILATISLWGHHENFISPARLGIGLLFSLLVTTVYAFMARHFDLMTGLFSSLSLLLMPRLFGHAHFSELDVPMAFAWFVCAAAFAEAVTRSWRWWVLAGLAFGLALLTKINALAIPAVLCPWAILYYRKRAILPCLFLAIGIPVFFLGWPWLWFDTLSHLRGYLETLSPKTRTPIPVYYLGTVYGKGAPAPFHYPLVLTVVTLPLGTVVASLWAAGKALGKLRQGRIEAFLIMNAGFILFSASMPGVPKYDGVRLFLPLFPFIACLAGLGLRRLWGWLVERLRSNSRVAALFGCYFAWLVVGLAWMHPFYLSYYGGAVGGAYGAHRVFKLESTYWAEVVDEAVIDVILTETPEGGIFAIYPHERFALDLLVPQILKERPDIQERHFDEGTWDLAVLNCRQGMFTEQAWNLYREGTPIFAHRRQGVPLCLVFKRERKDR